MASTCVVVAAKRRFGLHCVGGHVVVEGLDCYPVLIGVSTLKNISYGYGRNYGGITPFDRGCVTHGVFVVLNGVAVKACTA